jgi:N-acetylmuramoyl-L-alanine amidase
LAFLGVYTMNLISAWFGRIFGGAAVPPVPAPGPIMPTPAPAPPPVVYPPEWPTSDARTVLAMTAWMEDRSGGAQGMTAVMNVVVNRATNPRWWGTTIFSVCLKPYQFTSWNKGNPELPLCIVAMKSGDPQWKIAYDLAQLAVDNLLNDITDNADSYYAAKDPEMIARPPVWAHTAHYCGLIGGNKYFRVYLGPA